VRRLITPQPGYSLGDCNALLTSKQFVTADCFTIIPGQGAIVRLTDVQEDVPIVGWNDTNRYAYLSKQAVIKGLKSRSSMGTSVDEQDIEIDYAGDALFQGWKPWPQALLLGRLDGCRIMRDIAFGSMFGQWAGVARMFSGGDAELESVGRSSAKLKINSDMSRLSLQMPRDLFSVSCRNVFGDARCGVDLNALAVLGTVGTGATRSKLPWTSANSGYAFGKVDRGQWLPDLLVHRMDPAFRRLPVYPRCRDGGLIRWPMRKRNAQPWSRRRGDGSALAFIIMRRFDGPMRTAAGSIAPICCSRPMSGPDWSSVSRPRIIPPTGIYIATRSGSLARSSAMRRGSATKSRSGNAGRVSRCGPATS